MAPALSSNEHAVWCGRATSAAGEKSVQQLPRERLLAFVSRVLSCLDAPLAWLVGATTPSFSRGTWRVTKQTTSPVRNPPFRRRPHSQRRHPSLPRKRS
jgi:hypothetical protein